MFSTIVRTWLFAGIILPLFIIFFFSFISKEIEAEISISRWISRDKTNVKGDIINVKLTVVNKGERIPILNIMDIIPTECTVEEGSNYWSLELESGETVTLSYSIRCHERGRYHLGPVICKVSDIFHFNSRVLRFNVFNPYTVVPSLIKLRELPISRHKLLPETGNIPSLIYKGRDFDFQGVRDYQTGDELRTINWRITAKYNQLATNEYSFDQAARIFVIFDHTTSAKRVLEEGVTATLSTSEFLISQRNKVGFYGLGDLVEEIPAATGRRQLLRINEYLIDAKALYPDNNQIFELRLYRNLLSNLPPFSQIYFVSPLYNRIIFNLLIDLMKQGHEVVLIMPRLEEMGEKDPKLPKSSLLANALLSLNRAYKQNYLSNFEINQIHWYPTGPKYKELKVRRVR